MGNAYSIDDAVRGIDASNASMTTDGGRVIDGASDLAGKLNISGFISTFTQRVRPRRHW